MLMIVIPAMIGTGCSSGSASQSPASTASTQEQPAARTQQTTAAQGQQDGQKGGQDMQALQQKLLARVAGILGVSPDSLTTAYEAAMTSVMGDRAASATTVQGTPPQPPSDNKTPHQGGQGGPGKGGPDMSAIYSKIAGALGLTTEKVTAAFDQAREELMPSRTRSVK